MAEHRSATWYREEAERVRLKALSTDLPALRDSYLQLALAYDHLAETLERVRVPEGQLHSN